MNVDIHAEEATIKYAYDPSFWVDRPNQFRFLSIFYQLFLLFLYSATLVPLLQKYFWLKIQISDKS